jgi:membrane protease YdiL (CAAX protease family)
VKREPLVLAFALAFPVIMAWLYFVVASPPSDMTSAPNRWMQALYLLGKIVQFGAPMAWLAFADRSALQTLSPPGLRGDKPIDATYVHGIRWGVAVGLLFSALAFLVFMLVNRSELLLGVPWQIRAKLAQFSVLTPLRFAMLGAFLAIVNSGLEEYYWRWFVFGRLLKYLPIGLAVVLSSLGFMAHHVIVLWVYFPDRFLGAVVPFSLAIAVGGAVWAWIYLKSGSIAGPWISHFFVDVAIMLIGYLLAFHQ